MGGRKWNIRRGAAFAGVAALHVGLVSILIITPRISTRSSGSDFVTALILLSPPPATAVSSGAARSPFAPATMTPVRPMTPPPPESGLPDTLNPSIDWDTEAKRAAGALTTESITRVFGRNPATLFDGQRPHPDPPHQAGDQYRVGNEWIVWVSPHCYIVSSPPPLGMPDVLARSIPTTTVCQDKSKPAGEQFKDLPAYKKYHPQ